MTQRDQEIARANGWPGPAAIEQSGKDGPAKKTSVATLLVELALESVELFASTDNEAYATILVDNHRETWPVKSREFRRWLRRRFHFEQRRVPSSQAMQDALDTLAGEAEFQRSIWTVATRIAELDGKIYLDLGDDDWQLVEITPGGWQVTVMGDTSVRFRRPAGMLSLPIPTRGGVIDGLRRFVNVDSDRDFQLLVAWLLAALRPRGPFPVLVLQGEHGTAKSTTARVLRALVDPNKAPIRAEPRDERDLMITAGNSWVVALDNLSQVSAWRSDALCRLSTGGGFATRELHTDRGEIIFEAMRPLILNGIAEIATRGDLLDRAIVLTLPVIAESERQDEESFWRAFEEAAPRLLGALFDAVATGLKRIANIKLERSPRMADFARWGIACEPALGWPEGSFLEAYTNNREEAHELTLEASPLSAPLRTIAETGFQGTATELLAKLSQQVGPAVVEGRAWPKAANKLGVELRRLAPNLRAVGISVEFPALGKERIVTVGITDGAQRSGDGTPPLSLDDHA